MEAFSNVYVKALAHPLRRRVVRIHHQHTHTHTHTHETLSLLTHSHTAEHMKPISLVALIRSCSFFSPCFLLSGVLRRSMICDTHTILQRKETIYKPSCTKCMDTKTQMKQFSLTKLHQLFQSSGYTTNLYKCTSLPGLESAAEKTGTSEPQ